MCMAVTMVDSLRHSVWAVWFCLTCSHGVSELALTAGCSLAVKHGIGLFLAVALTLAGMTALMAEVGHAAVATLPNVDVWLCICDFSVNCCAVG